MNTPTIIVTAAAGSVAAVYGLVLASYLSDIAHAVNRLVEMRERDDATLAHELAILDANERRQ